MATSHLLSNSVRTGPLTALLGIGSHGAALAQAPSAADGPWSGQAQCVLSTRGTNYEDDQTHTWRLTGGSPVTTGSTRHWPAVWSVQGKGNRLISSANPGSAALTAATGGPSESWTIDNPDVEAPIAIWEIPGSRGNNRLRIGSQHGQRTVSGALKVHTSSGQKIAATLYEWQFPPIEDVSTATAISGTRTQNLVVGPGWNRPFTGATTTETCTWNFSKSSQMSMGRGGERGKSLEAGLTGGGETATIAPGTVGGTLMRGGGAGSSSSTDSSTRPTPGVTAPSAPVNAIATGRPGGGLIAAPSGVVTAATAVDPANFRATQTAEGTVRLSWDAMPGAGSYMVGGPGTNTGVTVNGLHTPGAAGAAAAGGGAAGAGAAGAGASVAAARTGSTLLRTDAAGGVRALLMPARTIALDGFTANGTAVTVAPRTIGLNGFTAAGTSVVVAPRTFALSGFTASGTSLVLPPRTIALPGFTAAGQAVTPRGLRK